jgi:hypothetical protein
MSKLWDLFFAGTRSGVPLPGYGQRYFEHVLAEYLAGRTLDTSPPTRILDVVARYQGGQAVTWADLYVLEKYILRDQPFDILKRRAWGLRANYRELLGQRAYETYLSSQPPDENDPQVQPQALRADLERLLGMLHWNYSLVPIREQIRTQAIRTSAYWMLFTLGLLLPLLAVCLFKNETFVALLLLVGFAGTMGGFVSLQRRLQTIPTDGDPLVSIFVLQNGMFALALAPISGAVFADVLFLIFLGGLLQGPVFPVLSDLGLRFHFAGMDWTLKDSASSASVAVQAGQVAKLVVWSFVAGFAERLVPDTIDRLVERGREVEKTAAKPIPSSTGPATQVTASPPADTKRSSTVDWRVVPKAASPPWH